MQHEQVYVKLTLHAYLQYCNRVEKVDLAQLESRLVDEVHAGQYSTHNRRRFMHVLGVWWIAEWSNKGRSVCLITCLGKSDYDLPAGIVWAEKFHDRINLGVTFD